MTDSATRRQRQGVTPAWPRRAGHLTWRNRWRHGGGGGAGPLVNSALSLIVTSIDHSQSPTRRALSVRDPPVLSALTITLTRTMSDDVDWEFTLLGDKLGQRRILSCCISSAHSTAPLRSLLATTVISRTLENNIAPCGLVDVVE